MRVGQGLPASPVGAPASVIIRAHVDAREGLPTSHSVAVVLFGVDFLLSSSF